MTRKILQKARETANNPVFLKPIPKTINYEERGNVILVTKIKPTPQ